jgi:hypothetical protein
VEARARRILGQAPSITTSAPSLNRSGVSRLVNSTGSAPVADPPACGGWFCTAKRTLRAATSRSIEPIDT